MAQFDVYRNRLEPGYLLDCQANLLSDLTTRFVVPLLPPGYAPHPSLRLNPRLWVGREEVVMMTHFAASIPATALGELVCSAAGDYTAIMNALDMLLTGY